jgi:hypothetical protein
MSWGMSPWGAKPLEKKAKARKFRTVIHKRRTIADRELDIDGFVKSTIEEAVLLYPNAVSLQAGRWPVISGSVIVARVRIEVEV